MVSGFDMRVGDAEREATAAELREHYASGRLTLEELNERLDRTFAAKTRGDLDALMRDLPSARPGTAGQYRAGARPGGPGPGWGGPAWGGPGAGWGGQGSGAGGPGASGWGPGTGRRTRNAIGGLVAPAVLVCALLVVGLFSLGGIGAGRPIGVVLILAAFALLRRLVFRRRVRARGPRRRRW